MERRSFLRYAGGILVLPGAAWAQRAARIPRIGLLITANPDPVIPLVREGLQRHGYLEGRNILLEVRSGNADKERLAAQAAELVDLKVDVLIAVTNPAAHAAKAASRGIPVVMAAGDAVGTGLVASLARPGGNVTGYSNPVDEMGGKLLQLIRETLPKVRRIAVLANASDAFTKPFLRQLDAAAQTMQIDLRTHMLKGADQYPAAFAAMSKARVDAVIVQPSLPRAAAADLARTNRIPAFCPNGGFPAEGGLLSYSPDTDEIYRGLGAYVDKILKGAAPAELPVQQPTKYDLRINLRTAREIGVRIPRSLLARADRLIE